MIQYYVIYPLLEQNIIEPNILSEIDEEKHITIVYILSYCFALCGKSLNSFKKYSVKIKAYSRHYLYLSSDSQIIISFMIIELFTFSIYYRLQIGGATSMCIMKKTVITSKGTRTLFLKKVTELYFWY